MEQIIGTKAVACASYLAKARTYCFGASVGLPSRAPPIAREVSESIL